MWNFKNKGVVNLSDKFLGIGLINALGIGFLTILLIVFLKIIFTQYEVEGLSNIIRMA